MKKSTLLLLGLALLLSSCRQDEGWQSLLDSDLSHWRVYQSYQHTNDFRGRAPVDENGEKIPPIGYDKNLYDLFTVTEEAGEPVLRVSGQTYGCVISNQSYRNYHLRLQVKFGQKRWEPRLEKALDSGLLYHSVGDAGVDYWLSWMRSFEFQVMQSGTTEGNSGDFWSIAGSKADIKISRPDPEKRTYYYDPEGEWLTVGSRGVTNFCGTEDHNSPDGEWTTLELICYEGQSLHIVNGEVVMALKNLRYTAEGGDVPLVEGRLQLQSEAGEVFYKGIEIRPLEQMPEEYVSYFE
ncbi:MAG: DUF1080 domain-containing protein [Alistipes sp.]|nr:DUF1080 domain-containing protein [Alistipes sp.]MBP3473776.1 DUF1080 domain-containing protein [Alistipes sp.]